MPACVNRRGSRRIRTRADQECFSTQDMRTWGCILTEHGTTAVQCSHGALSLDKLHKRYAGRMLVVSEEPQPGHSPCGMEFALDTASHVGLQ